MTNDNDMLSPLQEALAGVHMHTPVEAILQRAGAQRRKRRAALGATVAAELAPPPPSSPPASDPPGMHRRPTQAGLSWPRSP